MHRYKLKYQSQEALNADFLQKGLFELDQEGSQRPNKDKLLSLIAFAPGLVVLTPATIDTNGEEVSPAITNSDYLCEVLTSEPISFAPENLTDFPHKFAGVNIPANQ